MPVAFHSSYILDSMQFARTRRSRSVAHANSHAGASAGAARDGSNLTGPLSNVAATMFTKVVVWTPHCRTPLRRSRQLALSARV